jgi:Flp pilus assembly protein TadD
MLSEEEVAARLGQAELAAGRSEMALVRIDSGLRKTPDSISLHQMRGQALEDMGDFEGALAARRRALALEPDNPVLRNDLAWSLVLAGERPRRAVRLARSALAELSDHATVYGTLAAALLADGRPEQALATVEEALPRARDEKVRTHLLLLQAEASAQLGRPAEARSSYERALDGRSDDELPPSLGRLARRVREALEAS